MWWKAQRILERASNILGHGGSSVRGLERKRPVLLIWSSCAGKQDFVALNAKGVRDGVLRTDGGSVPHVTEEFL
jgi:hypothetical protein